MSHQRGVVAFWESLTATVLPRLTRTRFLVRLELGAVHQLVVTAEQVCTRPTRFYDPLVVERGLILLSAPEGRSDAAPLRLLEG